MGKNIKFLKKLTSLVLAGLTIFSSVPAKAWEEKDPRDAVQANVDKYLANGYKKITAQDISELLLAEKKYLEALKSSPIQRCADFILMLVCERKKIKPEEVVDIELCFNDIDFNDIGFYISRDTWVTTSLIKGFTNLIRIRFACNLKIPSSAFKELVNLESVEFYEFYDKDKGRFYNRDVNSFEYEHGYQYSFSGNRDTLFSKRIQKVNVFASKYVRNNMEKVITDSKKYKFYDVDELDYRNIKPLKLDESTEAITSEYASKVNGKRNIIIPEHVKKIEAGVFKNSKVMSVTFEEGMEEIEFCDECFAGCPLVKFELPKSLKKITLGEDCFKDCSNKVAIENYIRAEQTRIENEEIKKREEEERKRQEEEERKRKEEEERKRKEEEEKMKRKKEELETWKKETKQKIEKEKANLQKEISGDRDGDEIFGKNSLMYKRIEAQGVKNQYEKELKSFLKNHPEYITDEDIKLFEFNNKLIETAKTKFSSNKSSEIDSIRAELISKEDKLLRSKLEVAKLRVEIYDEKIKSKKTLISSLDDRLKDLEKITEIQKDYDEITKLMVENEVLKNNLKLRIEEAKKQKEEYEKLKNKLSEKEKLQKEIGIGHEKTAKELNEQQEEQERTDKRQAEEQKKLNERQKN